MSPPIETVERINALLALYRESIYDLELPRGDVVTLRLGEPPPPTVAHWIGDDDVGFYMTSCNPYSQSLPRDENEQRLNALREALRARNCRFLEGVGRMPGESWREQCVMVCGISDAAIADLVRIYEQNSVMIVHAGAPSTLRVYRPDWRALLGDDAGVEWG